MKHWLCVPVLAIAPLALAMSTAVHAQSADGYPNDDIALRAGPAPEYPEIEDLPYGTYVSVQGCTEDWDWCDVVSDQGDWGWVPGDYIDYVYEGEPVVVTEYGPRIGIPVVTFSIASYWDAHYRDRPFYRERETWFHRDIPRRAPPPRHHVADRKPPPPPPGGWHHGAKQPHQANAPQPPQHGEVHAPTRRENPPRAPANEPQRPRDDHHANVQTPMGPPAQPAPPRANVPQPPRHGQVPPPPRPASSTDHGKRPPQHPRKKDNHDNGDDNGH